MPTNDNSISVALVIDTSGSMTGNNYVDITKIDSKAFVNCVRQGDKIAICHYDEKGTTPYPLAEVTNTNSVIEDAVRIIQNLVFDGWSTNIAAGLSQGKSQIRSEAVSKGIVLLSDGYNNSGPGPLTELPLDYPIFSCAMGPHSDKDLMQQIAAKTTNGQYYYAPKVVDMMKIYNQIRALNPLTQGVANNLKSITPDNYELVPATIAQGNSEAQFVIAWTDTSLKYTSGNPTSTDLSITLVDPNMSTTNHKPTYIGEGYVVFNVHQPMVGTWQVQVLYGSAGKNLPVTVGVFEFQNDPDQTIALNLEVPSVISKGEPLKVKANVTHGNEKIQNITAFAEVTRPKISLENALEKYHSEYNHMEIPEDIKNGMPENIIKLQLLHQHKLPEIDILPHITTVHHFSEKDKDSHVATFTDTHEAGSYNVHVKVKGTSHINGTPFERNQLVTVLIK